MVIGKTGNDAVNPIALATIGQPTVKNRLRTVIALKGNTATVRTGTRVVPNAA